MNHRNLTSAVLFLTVCLTATSFAIQTAWKRHYVGKTALSLSLPGKLESAGETKVEDREDWVITTDDFTFENDEFFILISVFNGKSSTKADEKHLAQVGKDLVTGISTDEESVKETGKKTGTLDGKPTLIQSHVLGKGESASLFKSFLLGDGNKVYAVMAVGYPNDPKSVAAIDKVFASFRFKSGLKD